MRRSPQERWDRYGERFFDAACVKAGYFPKLLARAALAQSLKDLGLQVDFIQDRAGPGVGAAGDRVFPVHKMLTLGKDRKPINRLAEMYRETGIDELVQLTDVRLGLMHVCSFRPLQATSSDPLSFTHERMIKNLNASAPQLAAGWDGLTQTRKPGLLSSNSLYTKGRPMWVPPGWTEFSHYELKAAQDLHDYNNRSMGAAMHMVGQFGLLLASRAGALSEVTLAAEEILDIAA